MGQARRKLRPSLLTAVMLAGVIAAAVLIERIGLALPRDPDTAHLVDERLRRLAMHRAGETLPGTPDLSNLPGRLAASGLGLGAPVFIRVFKREFELELWLARDGRFHHFATYPICRFSGTLGPKLEEGDAQSPEGFYTVDQRALNAKSRWHRSFNLGFPNAHDRWHGRTGSALMVHGGCSSVGCFAMTNAVVDEIWRIVTAALKGTQQRIHVHVFPFRMSDEALSERAHGRWAPFWADLKAGHDAFEARQRPPRIAVCGGRYQVRDSAERLDPGPVEQVCEDGLGLASAAVRR